MSDKTKIIVVHMKEVIYTIVFAILLVLFFVLLIFMFREKKETVPDGTLTKGTYTPGVYTSSIMLNNQAVNVEVVVDEDHINSVRLVNINEAVTTMFPLVEPAFESISSQIYNGVALSDITYDDNTHFTSELLLNAIGNSLSKAENPLATPDTEILEQ